MVTTNELLKTRESIVVRSQFVAFHRWKDAPDVVAFLRDYHRHVFKVEVHLAVTHADRQLEFFIVQRDLNDILLHNFEGTRFEASCECVARSIMEKMEAYKAYTSIFKVVVSEDGENDGVVEKLYQ